MFRHFVISEIVSQVTVFHYLLHSPHIPKSTGIKYTVLWCYVPAPPCSPRVLVSLGMRNSIPLQAEPKFVLPSYSFLQSPSTSRVQRRSRPSQAVRACHLSTDQQTTLFRQVAALTCQGHSDISATPSLLLSWPLVPHVLCRRAGGRIVSRCSGFTWWRDVRGMKQQNLLDIGQRPLGDPLLWREEGQSERMPSQSYRCSILSNVGHKPLAYPYLYWMVKHDHIDSAWLSSIDVGTGGDTGPCPLTFWPKFF